MAYTNTLTVFTANTVANANEMNSRMSELKGNEDYNKAQHELHVADKTNPHAVTKTHVGLSNVDNTSDADKPTSTLQAAALALKVDKVAGKQLSTEDFTTTLKDKLDGVAAGASGAVVAEVLPAVANRINNTFYKKYHLENGIPIVDWEEDWTGKKFDIHNYPTKVMTMDALTGLFPSPVKCANHFIRGLTVKGQTYINEIKNGNFASGTTGWTASNATLSASNNTLIVTASNTASYSGASQVLNLPYVVNKNLRIKLKARVTNANCTSIAVWVIAAGMATQTLTLQSTPTQNEWYEKTLIVTLPTGGSGNISIRIVHNYADATTANGKVMEIEGGEKGVMCLDLDKNPSLATLTADQINTRLPRYFEGMASTGDLDIPSNPLRWLPNVRDTIDNPATGAVTRRTGKAILNGSGSWTASGYSDNTYLVVYTNIADMKLSSVLSCDKLKYIALGYDPTSLAESVSTISTYQGRLYVKILKSKAIDVSTFVAWLALNNLTVTYELITPVTETVSPSLFKTYILADVNGQMQRVQISDNLRKVGTVADELGIRRITGVIEITGSLSFINSNAYVGSKRAGVALPYPALAGAGIVIKNNGNYLSYLFDALNIDTFFVDSTTLRLTTSNIDTGFTDSLTPSTSEWKAYFLGWKMCMSDGSTWDGVSTKYWKKITDGTGITSVLPTATYTGFTPYKFMYQLATPTYEAVDITQFQTYNGDNTIKYMGAVVPSEMTMTVCQTPQQVKDEDTTEKQAIWAAIAAL